MSLLTVLVLIGKNSFCMNSAAGEMSDRAGYRGEGFHHFAKLGKMRVSF